MTAHLIDHKAALIVAHPGHEVLLHAWLVRARPKLLILTDGSGRAGQSRIEATRQYVSELGIPRGPIFGRFTDLQLYEAILNQDLRLFQRLANEILELLLNERIDYVVGDSAEGYNSVHDVCRLLLNCAVSRANNIYGCKITNFDYPVVSGLAAPLPNSNGAVHLELDQATYKCKLEAARRYYPELVVEVAQTIAGTASTSYQKYLEHLGQATASPSEAGWEVFRTENLNPVPADYEYQGTILNPPFYEWSGEQRALSGDYKSVIRYGEHVLPIARALQQHATAKSVGAS